MTYTAKQRLVIVESVIEYAESQKVTDHMAYHVAVRPELEDGCIPTWMTVEKWIKAYDKNGRKDPFFTLDNGHLRSGRYPKARRLFASARRRLKGAGL